MSTGASSVSSTSVFILPFSPVYCLSFTTLPPSLYCLDALIIILKTKLTLTQLPRRFHCMDELIFRRRRLFKNSNSMTSAWETSACGFVVCFFFVVVAFHGIQNQKKNKKRETRENDVVFLSSAILCLRVLLSYSDFFFFSTLWLASSVHPMSFICWLM